MKKYFTFLSKSSSQTKGLGRILAKEILKSPPQNGAFVLGLKGDLGGGKTTFLQGLSAGLGIREKILSPTFIIFRRNRIKGSKKFQTFFHFDCYRIKEPKEIIPLGFGNIVSDPKNIVAIEWSERIKEILPPGTIFLEFEFINEKTREIHVFARGK